MVLFFSYFGIYEVEAEKRLEREEALCLRYEINEIYNCECFLAYHHRQTHNTTLFSIHFFCYCNRVWRVLYKLLVLNCVNFLPFSQTQRKQSFMGLKCSP